MERRVKRKSKIMIEEVTYEHYKIIRKEKDIL